MSTLPFNDEASLSEWRNGEKETTESESAAGSSFLAKQVQGIESDFEFANVNVLPSSAGNTNIVGASEDNFERKIGELNLQYQQAHANVFGALGRLESLGRMWRHENKLLKRTIQLLKTKRNKYLSENERLKIKQNEAALSKRQLKKELELERSQRKLCEEKLMQTQKVLQKSTEELSTFNEDVGQMTSSSDTDYEDWEIIDVSRF